MKQCRITVLKRAFYKDLNDEYCVSNNELCPCFQEGQVFEAGFEQPESFCGWAWNDIYKYVSAILSGGSFSKGAFEGWMKHDNTIIACCTDGVRPVSFKIELIDEN